MDVTMNTVGDVIKYTLDRLNRADYPELTLHALRSIIDTKMVKAVALYQDIVRIVNGQRSVSKINFIESLDSDYLTYCDMVRNPFTKYEQIHFDQAKNYIDDVCIKMYGLSYRENPTRLEKEELYEMGRNLRDLIKSSGYDDGVIANLYKVDYEINHKTDQ